MYYSLGDRIELVSMENDPDPIAPGERGTIDYLGAVLQGQRQIGVKWDSGRSLMLLLPMDKIRKVQS